MRCLLLPLFAFAFPGALNVVGQEKPLPFRLSDQQVQAAAANIDAAWEQACHDHWKRSAENSRRYNPGEPVEPEPPLPLDAADGDFLRRATLDATGLIPTEVETRAFFNDPAPGRRQHLVDRLLLSPGWSRQQFNRYADLLRLSDMIGGMPQAGYIALVRLAAETNVPFDKLVVTLLTASGNVTDNPATGFLLRDQGNLLLTMDHIAGGLLRADVHCAMCHDHPFSDVTQRQFYEFSAFFGATEVTLRKPANPVNEIEVWPRDASRALMLEELDRTGLMTVRDGAAMGLKLGSDYKYRDGRPGDLVKRAVSFPVEKHDPRKIWTSPRNLRGEFGKSLTGSARFADATACAQLVVLFGRDERPGTFSTAMDPKRSGFDCNTVLCYPNTGLWELLGNEKDVSRGMVAMRELVSALLRRVQFDLREFQRVLMHTQAYGREANKAFVMGEPVFSRPPAPMLRRFTPEQIWDTLVMLGGVDGREFRFAGELPQTLPETHPLRILGRGERIRGDDAVRRVSASVVRLMMNSELVQRVMKPDSALLSSVTARFRNSPVQQAEALFLAVLSRMPDERERAQAIGTIAAGADGAGQVAWSLLNTSEFLFER